MTEPSLIQVMSDNSQMRGKIDELKNIISTSSHTLNECIKKQQMVSDNVENMKLQIKDKVPKATINELNEQINVHSKLVGDLSKKIHEIKNNLDEHIKHPISDQFVESLRQQINMEILTNTKALMDEDVQKINKYIDDRMAHVERKIDMAKRMAVK